MKYRIMCQGEDGMEFCVKNNIPNAQLNEEFESAEDNYPEGKLWSEPEDSYQQAAQFDYEEDFPYDEDYD